MKISYSKLNGCYIRMQNLQNINYGPNFSARLLMYDSHKIVPRRLKHALEALSENLGQNHDEIHLFVSKSKDLVSNVEMESYNGLIKRGYIGIDYIVGGMKNYNMVKAYNKKITALKNQKESIPTHLIKIFEECILPLFGKNEAQIEAISKDLDHKFFHNKKH